MTGVLLLRICSQQASGRLEDVGHFGPPDHLGHPWSFRPSKPYGPSRLARSPMPSGRLDRLGHLGHLVQLGDLHGANGLADSNDLGDLESR
jgi:hypothetical protein